MIVSHTHRFVFLKSRKTAGTSVEAALSSLCSGDDVVSRVGDISWNRTHEGERIHQAMNHKGFRQHEPALSVREKFPGKVWEEYFKFSITRNPWDRVVSLFFWRTKKPKKYPKIYLPPRKPWHFLVPKGIREKRIREGFSQFVEDIDETNDEFYFIGNRLCVDHVIRFENLQGDFDEVCRKLGLPRRELPRLKTGFNTKSHYSRLYSDRTREIVGRRHRNDIEQFGYRFERA
jgi:hypothetical protein